MTSGFKLEIEKAREEYNVNNQRKLDSYFVEYMNTVDIEELKSKILNAVKTTNCKSFRFLEIPHDLMKAFGYDLMSQTIRCEIEFSIEDTKLDKFMKDNFDCDIRSDPWDDNNLYLVLE